MALLGEAEPGLLTDLDGLDPEFDDWLRKIRGQEPERSLSAALSAVDRCRAEAGPRAAIELVTALLRFDPANEEATRSALQLDHELGDNAALYRHFHSLKERLAVDFDAAPSNETVELFERLSNERASVTSDGSRLETGPSTVGIVTPVAPRRARSIMPVLTVLVLAAAALAALIWNKPRQASTDYPVIVAVMPFDQKPKQDNFLAAGLWGADLRSPDQEQGLPGPWARDDRGHGTAADFSAAVPRQVRCHAPSRRHGAQKRGQRPDFGGADPDQRRDCSVAGHVPGPDEGTLRAAGRRRGRDRGEAARPPGAGWRTSGRADRDDARSLRNVQRGPAAHREPRSGELPKGGGTSSAGG